MAIIKIHYHNCEEQGECEIEVNCPPSEYKAVKNFIDDYKKKNPFHTGVHNFISMLESYGFKAKEVKYDIEVY